MKLDLCSPTWRFRPGAPPFVGIEDRFPSEEHGRAPEPLSPGRQRRDAADGHRQRQWHGTGHGYVGATWWQLCNGYKVVPPHPYRIRMFSWLMRPHVNGFFLLMVAM